jgi:hypothetical protein
MVSGRKLKLNSGVFVMGKGVPLVSIVTAPFSDKSLPTRLAPVFRVILASAIILPFQSAIQLRVFGGLHDKTGGVCLSNDQWEWEPADPPAGVFRDSYVR